MKHNFCNWLSENLIYVLILISWSFSIVLLGTLFDFRYLKTIYERSWSMSYIRDITTVLKDEECPGNYQKISIGAWSGFNKGCLCGNLDEGLNVNSEVIPSESAFYASENNDCDIDPKIKEVYETCIEIPYVRPYMLTTFKGFDICALYSTQNYTDLSDDFNAKLKSYYSEDGDFDEYLKASHKVDMSDTIYDDAITDIIFVNTTITDISKIYSQHKIDTSLYEQKSLKSDYVMLIKRMKNEDDEIKNSGLKAVRKLISDIHLSNDLWCAYLDISVPIDKMDNTNGKIEFGYEYCNKFYTQGGEISNYDANHYIISYRKELFFNDQYFRTNKIPFEDYDDTFYNSKYDFYNWNYSITQYYNKLLYMIMHPNTEVPATTSDEYKNFFISNKINPTHYSPLIMDGSYGPQFKPILVYENYLEGIGCYKFLDPKDHLHKIDGSDKLKNGSQLLVGLNSILFLILVFNYFAKAVESRRLILIFFSVLIIFNIIAFIVAAAISVKLRGLRNYMMDYQFYCQNDFSLKYSSSSTLPMEVHFVNSLGFSTAAATLNAALLAFSFLFEVLYFCRLYRERGENKMEEIIEFSNIHKKVDQTDIRSKVNQEDVSATYRKDDDSNVV